LEWEPSILGLLGITKERLSEVVQIDKMFYSPQLFPSLQKIPFVVGGSDGAMANLGSTEEAGSLVITVGTSSAARIIVNKPWTDPLMRTFCYYINNNQWLVGGASNNGGIVLQWLQEDFFKSNKTVAQFLAQATSVNPGSDGLIFLPYLLGERAPIWDENAKGILFGLQISHSQATMVRASLEGIVYCIYAISQAILEQSEILKIVATGGFAQNELGLQILADIFDLPVLVCETIENSAWGAAKCGMLALGIQAPSKTLISKMYSPNSSTHEVYAKGFLKFQKLYEKLKHEFI
jgi:gluconokinase